MSELAHLEALRRWLAHSLAAALGEAVAVEEPAGTSSGWQQVCAHFGVPLIDERERDQVRVVQKPLRGAPVMELHGVVVAIVRQARQSLGRFAGDEALESGVDKLRLLLDRVERETVEAYKRAVLPRRRGMFDHVLDHKSGGAAWAPGCFVLSCFTCGAPQLQERELRCPFCGNQMTASP